MDHPGEESAEVPGLGSRVSGLEANVDRILAVLTRLEPRLAKLAFTSAKATGLNTLQSDVAEIKGRVSSLPTCCMLMITVLSPWTVGAGIVFTLVKASHS